MSLTTTVKTIQDIMRKDVGVDGDAQRVAQLVWMLFLKVLDEQEKQAELNDTNYTPLLQEAYRWRNWARFEDRDGLDDDENRKRDDELIEFVNESLFPALQDTSTFQGKRPLAKVVGGMFQEVENKIRSGSLLRQVIDKIEKNVHLESFEDRQHLGDVYEKLLKDLQSAGNAGEFYTPKAVTQFIVDRIAPQKGESVLDPACGTGGFLAEAVKFVKGSQRDVAEFGFNETIQGVEKKPLPHMLATTNMILQGVEVPLGIRNANTLSLYKDWPRDAKVDVVITNPPFGGMEEDGIEKSFPKEFQTRETADLFIHFIYEKMLTKGGRCAVVLPDGFLFGEGMKSRLKEDLMQKCNLHTIVRLPNGVFNPYTGIKSNILFFDKGKPTETVWFYEHPYPPGYKNYSKTRPMQFKEFTSEQKWWGNRVENEHAWKYSFGEEKEKARVKAEPHYLKQDEFEKEKNSWAKKCAAAKRKRTGLKKEITAETSRQKKSQLKIKLSQQETAIAELEKMVTDFDRKAKDEKNAGDRIKYAIYNLDQANPHTNKTEVLDPDKLMKQYEALQIEIQGLRDKLKNELAAVLEV